MSFTQHVFAVSKSCYHNIRDLILLNFINLQRTLYITTSLIHAKIDYGNSLLLNLAANQTHRPELVLNSAAPAVTKTPKLYHITAILGFPLA